MENEIKKWLVEYSHEDGRNGMIEVETEIQDSGAFHYGNGKAGAITVGGYTRVYDLRYNHGDLHRLMLDDYFGDGLRNLVEIF